MEQNLKINETITIPGEEISWRFSRSGGPGGQNVNKVESRVTILFNLAESQVFTDEQKALIKEKLSGQIDSDGNIFLDVSEERSQLRNRDRARKRLAEKLAAVLIPQKKRKKTRTPATEKKKRLELKKARSKVKELRKRSRSYRDEY